MMKRITRLSSVSYFLLFLFSFLDQPHRGKCRLIDCRCDRQSVVSLVGCDGFPGHRPKDTIDWSIVITGNRQRFLNVDGHPVRRQSVVAVDRAVIHIAHVRREAPCREPVAHVPVPPAAIHEDDPSVVASPPTAIVPLPVVIAERPILLAAECVTTPVVSDSHIAFSIKGGVRCPVDRDVSIPIDRYVIATAKLIGVSKTVS